MRRRGTGNAWREGKIRVHMEALSETKPSVYFNESFSQQGGMKDGI